jgi:DNA-binding IclR family transcriptional regulator
LAGQSFDRVGPNTLETLDELMERLGEIRRRGFGLQDEELTIGHRSAAAPVHDHTGAVAAAVSVSVPTARVSRQQLIRFATESLVPAARAISVGRGECQPAGSPCRVIHGRRAHRHRAVLRRVDGRSVHRLMFR